MKQGRGTLTIPTHEFKPVYLKKLLKKLILFIYLFLSFINLIRQ